MSLFIKSVISALTPHYLVGTERGLDALLAAVVCPMLIKIWTWYQVEERLTSFIRVAQ